MSVTIVHEDPRVRAFDRLRRAHIAQHMLGQVSRDCAICAVIKAEAEANRSRAAADVEPEEPRP